MPISFDLLFERLLREGVARRHARRYVAELRDHLADLTAEEQASGAPNAEARALARLGSTDTLAAAMVERREFRSWRGRWPALVYLAAAPIALAAGCLLAMVSIVAMAKTLTGPGLPTTDLPAWAQAVAAGVLFGANSLLAVGLGWGLAALAIRQRSRPAWPVVGMVVLAIMGAALEISAKLPTPTTHGEIGWTAGIGTNPSGFPARLALNLALILLPYAAIAFWFSRASITKRLAQ